jgi:predicted O-linked N-acetylglucosamine transferase (SPINDLY family)
VLRLTPDEADAHNEAAAALGTLGRSGEAEAHARQALQLRPDDAEASHNLAVLLAARRQFAEAAELFRAALRQRPDLVQASLSLGRALIRQGLLDEAEDVLRAALPRSPEVSQIHAALGEVLAGQGFLADAERAFRDAVRLDADNAAAHSSLLLTLCMDPKVTPTELLAASRRWAEQHGQATVLPAAPEDSGQERPLRVGYLSQDLLGHVVMKFFGPVLANHDRTKVETFCYADILSPDAVTGHLRALASGWRVIHGLNDDEVARRIQQDRIDVLVDLAGHTGNRLGVFARRPAAVQITWLGYPATHTR